MFLSGTVRLADGSRRESTPLPEPCSSSTGTITTGGADHPYAKQPWSVRRPAELGISEPGGSRGMGQAATNWALHTSEMGIQSQALGTSPTNGTFYTEVPKTFLSSSIHSSPKQVSSSGSSATEPTAMAESWSSDRGGQRPSGHPQRLSPLGVRAAVSNSSLPTIAANVPLAGVEAVNFCPTLVLDSSSKQRCLQPINSWDNLEVAIADQRIPTTMVVSSPQAAASAQTIVDAADANELVQVEIAAPRSDVVPSTASLEGTMETALVALQLGASGAPQFIAGQPTDGGQHLPYLAQPDVGQATEWLTTLMNIVNLPVGNLYYRLPATHFVAALLLPGSAAVKLVILTSLLLTNPTGSHAIQMDPTRPPEPGSMALSARPLPLYGYNPYEDYTSHEIPITLGNTSQVRLLAGSTLILQVATTEQAVDLVRYDRVIDIQDFSRRKHNAQVWIDHALRPGTIGSVQPFKPIALETSGEKLEAFKVPEAITVDKCSTMALAYGGHLPSSLQELRGVSQLFDEKSESLVWMSANQQHSGSTFDSVNYNLTLQDYWLFPNRDNTPKCKVFHNVNGESVLIADSQIHSLYSWYDQPSQKYHVWDAWKLAVAINPKGLSCSIFIPSDPRSSPPPAYLQQCVILRDGRKGHLKEKTILQALQRQHERLQKNPLRVEPVRLQNANRTLPPLSMEHARVVQDLLTGVPQLLLTQDPVTRVVPMELLEEQDLRGLTRGSTTELHSMDPTPAAILSAGAGFLVATAGSTIVKELTTMAVQKMFNTLQEAGNYRLIHPRKLARAVRASSPSAYEAIINQELGQHIQIHEDANIMRLRVLKEEKKLPHSAILSHEELENGISVVESEATLLNTLEEQVYPLISNFGLGFLSQSEQKLSLVNGALVSVARSSSAFVASYFIPIIKQDSTRTKHILVGLPSYNGRQDGTATVLDLPSQPFTVHVHSKITNATKSQVECGLDIVSGSYENVLSSHHPSCRTKEVTVPLTQLLAEVRGTRFLLVHAKPTTTKLYLDCRHMGGQTWPLEHRYSLFILPASCSLSISHLGKLSTFSSTLENSDTRFVFLAGWNTNSMPLKLTTNEEITISLGSTLGALFLTTLALGTIAFKFRSRLRNLAEPVDSIELEVPASGASTTYTHYDDEAFTQPPPMPVYNTRPSVLNLTTNRARLDSQPSSSLTSRAPSMASLAPVRGPHWRQPASIV